MKTLLVVVVILMLAGCQNLAQYSQAYQDVHQKVYWEKLNGGGMDGGAQAWANLAAHTEAERTVGK